MKQNGLVHVIVAWLVFGCLATSLGAATGVVRKEDSRLAKTAPLQTFTVKDYLQHQWTDEIIHFPISYRGQGVPESLTLTDAAGRPTSSQVTGLAQQNGKVTGTAWTLVSLAPMGQATFQLRPGRPAPSSLRLLPQGQYFLLGNEFIVLRLPRLPGAVTPPVDLASMPAPLLAVGAAGSRTGLAGAPGSMPIGRCG